ncbi:uncharacterized protein [Physcomitrium patens]|uniref:uncharacterized protein n=1 Tax=Physcomitrium patens TaxID=3218 RepID=UPI003CCCC811
MVVADRGAEVLKLFHLGGHVKRWQRFQCSLRRCVHASSWIRELSGTGFVGSAGKVATMTYLDLCTRGNHVIDLDNNCLTTLHGPPSKLNSKTLKLIAKHSLFGRALLQGHRLLQICTRFSTKRLWMVGLQEDAKPHSAVIPKLRS